MVTSHQTKNRNNHVRKKDLSSEYWDRLENRNPELHSLHELIEQYENGESIEGKVENPYVPNSYIRALLTLRDLEYPVRASDVAKLCDVATKKVATLKKHGLAKVVRTNYRKADYYVISERGEGLLKALNIISTAENYSPGFYDRSIGDLRRTTKRWLIPRLLKKHHSILEETMSDEFNRLFDMYNNPICNPSPETMNSDLNQIYGKLEEVAGGQRNEKYFQKNKKSIV